MDWLIAVFAGLLLFLVPEFLFGRWFKHKERFVDRMVSKQKGNT